ncbi:hypothetical protein PAMP_023294 [Pampus punctatissimus]
MSTGGLFAQIGLCAPFFRGEVTGRSSLYLQPAVGEREPVQPSCVENFGLGTSWPSAAPGLQQPAAKRRNTSATGGFGGGRLVEIYSRNVSVMISQ